MASGDQSGVDLSWIVVSHESAADLGGLLPSLREALTALAREGLASEVVLADNASRDGSVDVVRRLLPEATVLELPVNRGYGAAINTAARVAQGRWLTCSNADLLVAPEGLSGLAEVLAAVPPQVALIAPALHDEDGSLQLSVGRPPTLPGLLAGLFRPPAGRAFVRRERHCGGPVDWASGACLFARADAFAAVGGFDERFFLYYEECDLALRLARRGHGTWYEPSLAIVHRRPHHGRPRDARIEAHVRRSRTTFFRTHRPAWEAAAVALLARVEPLLRRGQAAAPAGEGELSAQRAEAAASARAGARA